MLLLLAGCSTAPSTTPAPSLDSALQETDDGAALAVEDLMPDEADKLLLACPYSSIDALAEEAGIDASSFEINKSQLPHDDGTFALLTVEGDTVRHLGTYDRTPIDLCGAGKTWGSVLTLGARLELASADEGKTWAPSTASRFSALEQEYDARLAVFALDTGTGQTVSHRPDERFAYASTAKAFAAAVALDQTTDEELDTLIFYDASDLLSYAPITERHVDTGMTLRELSDAAVRYSDNTAYNLILDQIGGTVGLDAELETIGDDVTQMDREEPELNEATPGDLRDTSTARALAGNLQAFVLGDALDADDRETLTGWLVGNTTGDALIRAGVPDTWTVGDKTGAASYGTRNDIAVLWPPDGAPIVLAVLSSRDEADAAYDDALIAEATAEVVAAYGYRY